MNNGIEFPDEFWIDLFEQTIDPITKTDNSSIKLCLDQKDKIYSNTNVAIFLEKIASYLINCPEVKEEETLTYKIYHSKEMFDKSIKDEKEVRKLSMTTEDKLTMSIFKKERNFKKAKDVVIKPRDIRLCNQLRDYDYSLNKLKDLNRNSKVIRIMSEIKKDMLLVYDSFFRPIRFKSPLRDEGEPDWSKLDMMDKGTMKELIKLKRTDEIHKDINCILLDVELLINRTNLKDKHREILTLYREGYSNKEIADKLDTSKQNIGKYIDRCVENLTDQYHSEYEDWYYLNISKGKYHRCKVCGEVKLDTKFYKHTTRKRKNTCKECI
ncbi:RNA polymerase sigma factor [Peptostreptococcus faecalis]|uniref:RNA polymerase sigma factor n=1 Tax=Peptostreptococcus faecalis TaxID=2045015 RepID=UPI000C7C854C|nr:sigma factor-like helix-turn-helix DNA-binding protein [Peptostreptococcus faecalis]